jgi:hypothetical protein
MSNSSYDFSVFINCPFDDVYKSFFDAVVFTVYDCGFIARCALEIIDAGQIRIERISQIIAECKYGIHDISRTELDSKHKLPRFNMPLELGLFMGAKRFGSRRQNHKSCLILDKEQYRYQKYCSDISGQDIESHSGNVRILIRKIRDWLSASQRPIDTIIPSGSIIFKRYKIFMKEKPLLCQQLNLDSNELTFSDFSFLISEWLKINSLKLRVA